MGARGVIGAGSALAVVVAALVASTAPIPAVDIQLFQFQPGVIEVQAGTTLGGRPHADDRRPAGRGDREAVPGQVRRLDSRRR